MTFRPDLQIQELDSNGDSLCGNKPSLGKMPKLGSGRVTCGSCARVTGHSTT